MRAAVLLAGLLFATPAVAADCSVGAIPDTPVKGTVNGVPFVPQEAWVSFTADGMSMNEAHFDRYQLSIQTDSIFNALSVSMLVPKGKTLAGRVFRVLPTDSISGQPAAAQGLPEVQGWDLELEAAGVDTSFTSDIASIRVEWGAKSGDTVSGKIHFCVPSANADIAGTFKAKMR